MNDLLPEISRFIFPRLNCRQFLQEESYRNEINALIGEGVGGFILFDGNIDDCARAVELVRNEARERPLILAADCEFGLTMRFPGGTEFPGAWALGSADDLDLTFNVAVAIAREMRAVGLDWNLAPVLDVNTNPANPIINLRSFGENPEHVAEHGTAFIRGLKEGGVISCGKHFPGHGDTAVDSHISLPVLPFDLSRLNAVELIPFRRAIEAGVPSIMSAHLAVPALDPSNVPASLSSPILEEFLRKSLGFEGVLITDALDMGAIVETYGTAETVVRAFLAGNDVLEIPDDPFAAIEGLRQAQREGRISADRVAESSRRLDDLFRDRASKPADLPTDWKALHEELALQVARKALKTEWQAVPFNRPDSVVALTIRDETGGDVAGRWHEMLTASFDVKAFEVETGALNSSFEERLHNSLKDGRSLLLSLMVRPRGGAGSVGLGEGEKALRKLIEEHPTLLVNFGNPYLLREFDFPARIDAFSSSMPSLQAALEVLSKSVM